jgi:hypothetical protein
MNIKTKKSALKYHNYHSNKLQLSKKGNKRNYLTWKRKYLNEQNINIGPSIEFVKQFTTH